MSLRDCLNSAVDQGAISRAEADDLLRAYNERHAQLKMSMGDGPAAAAAKDALAKELKAEAIEARRRVLLAAAAQDRIAEYLATYRNAKGKADVFGAVLNLIEHYGFAGTSSVAGRAKAIVSLAHGEMQQFLQTFDRSRLTGARRNQPLAKDVAREMLGEATGQPEAKAMADAASRVFESLRQRFNAAGGTIGKIEGGYLPQFHDPRALLGAKRDPWKDFIRPRLDLDRMRDPLTGDKLTPGRLEQVLDYTWDQVTTGGWAHRAPTLQPVGRGSVASQRADERFLHFKSAEDWLAYNEQFGRGDPIQAVFNHLNGMARDIAAMEILGPNPNATINWLKQIAQSEAGKVVTGKPSLYDPGAASAAGTQDKIDYLGWRIDSVYGYVRGREVVSKRTATGFGTVRNLLASAKLGSAVIAAAVGDPFIDRAARTLSGLPATKALWGILNALPVAQRMTREQAVRSGMVLDDFLHILGDEARYAGTLGGAEWSRWLADRTMVLSGLEPITQTRKHTFALDWQASLADNAEVPFAELPAYTRRAMEGYGLDATAWDVIRGTEQFRPQPDSAGFIQPADVARLADGPALPNVQKLLGIDATDAAVAAEQTSAGVRRIAEQYLEMILGETERAVPSGTARSKSFFVGRSPKGSIWSEIVESGLQFKGFLLSFSTLQWQAIQQEVAAGGVARGAAYAGGLFLPLTLGGALAVQFKAMSNGKDPQPMDDPKFWLAAMQTGGGLGLAGDFLFADVNRFGQTFAEMMAGPTVGLGTDLWKLGAGNLQQLIQGKPTKAGREALNFTGRYTPVLGSLWQTRAAYRRVILDQLDYLVDPEAHKYFREQESRLRRETGQAWWWRPGAALPERAPDLSGALSSK